MRQIRTLCLLASLMFPISLLAQGAGSAAPSNAQATKPAPTIASSVDREVSIIEREFVSVAEAMPEEKFNFSPEALNIQGSDYKKVRTFAEPGKHVAATKYGIWAAATGEKAACDVSEGERGSE